MSGTPASLAVLTIAAVILGACELPPPTLDEVLGTYRLDGSGFTATIVVKAGGIWEYKFDNAHAFQRSGPWSRLQTADSPSTLALQLDNFVFGFEFRPYPRLDAPTTYVMNLEKDPSGHISACLTEDNLFCFKKQ